MPALCGGERDGTVGASASARHPKILDFTYVRGVFASVDSARLQGGGAGGGGGGHGGRGEGGGRLEEVYEDEDEVDKKDTEDAEEDAEDDCCWPVNAYFAVASLTSCCLSPP